MAKINNSQVIQKLVDELKLYPGKDVIPTELAEKILAVYQVNTQEVITKNPTSNIVKVGATTGGSGANTIYTTPATGKFYLTGYTITSVGGAGTTDYIQIYVGAVAYKIALLDNAGGLISMALTYPILVDAATIISLWNGLPGDVSVMIMGYTEE